MYVVSPTKVTNAPFSPPLQVCGETIDTRSDLVGICTGMGLRGYKAAGLVHTLLGLHEDYERPCQPSTYNDLEITSVSALGSMILFGSKELGTHLHEVFTSSDAPGSVIASAGTGGGWSGGTPAPAPVSTPVPVVVPLHSPTPMAVAAAIAAVILAPTASK